MLTTVVRDFDFQFACNGYWLRRRKRLESKMAVQAAIFDCDGTLLDSMGMWADACIDLLKRHGVEDAKRVFEENESLDMHAKCVWYHEHLGIGKDSEELFGELWNIVEEAYRKDVRPFAGCAEFLEALARGGVRMVLASATPAKLLQEALEAHGLLRYFERTVFVGDVGRDKSFPDVYVAAQECLGTRREDTWVFEDAPFGVRAAARAGFPVVAIYNDHDGRDKRFLSHWATMVSDGYECLRVSDLEGLQPHVFRALVVGGSPEQSPAQLVARLADNVDYVIAADAGADALMTADVVPDVFCGDADSASGSSLAWIERGDCLVMRHPREKDDTDLGLCLRHAQEEAERRGCCLRLTVTSVSGGRQDHALGVWGLLKEYASAAPHVVENDFECRILTREGNSAWCLDARVGQTVSVVALAEGTLVSESGTRWTLDHERLPLLSDRGISNWVTDESCTIVCHEGVLAAFVL